MAKFSLDGFYKILFDIDPETNDFNLEENEYIRIVAIKANDKDVIITKFFKHKSEIEEFVKKYKYTFNETICRFCDKSKCNAIFENTKADEIEGTELSFDNNLLKNTMLRNLSGYHYMILSIFDFHKKPLKRQDIIRGMTGRKTKVPCISGNTLRKVLADLIGQKKIAYDEQQKLYKLIDIPNYGAGYTRYYYSATLLLVNKVITPTEYLVYLCLIRNLQANENVVYDTLADNLNMDKANISRAIKGLHEAGCLKIDKSYDKNGKIYNVYKIVA